MGGWWWVLVGVEIWVVGFMVATMEVSFFFSAVVLVRRSV